MDTELRQAIDRIDPDTETEEQLRTIADERQQDLDDLRQLLASHQDPDRLQEMRRRFPTFTDPSSTVPAFEDYDRLMDCVLVAWLLEEEVPEYYAAVRDRVEALQRYLEGEEDALGEQVFRFLTSGRTVDDDQLRSELRQRLDDVDTEFMDYDNEAEVYEDRDIDDAGLIVGDAVKCLEDFEGRTFPFIRAICAQIDAGMQVLEPGIGTGVLSVAAVLNGADEAVGIELNPVTCILAKVVRDRLVDGGVIPEDSITICWGDALEFGYLDFQEYGDDLFDAIITENIYTGMFFELQMQMISRILENGLVPAEKALHHGFYRLSTDVPVIPSAMSSCVELVELEEPYDGGKPTEVLLDLQEQGNDIRRRMSKDHPFDQIDFSVRDPSNILSKVKFRVLEDGRVDAVNLYSTIRLMDGDYIDRNENEFLNNDSLLFLDEPLEVEEGDIVVLGLAFNEAYEIADITMELRVERDGEIPEEYDARLNVPERQHLANRQRFRSDNNLQQPLDLRSMGDFEVLRSSSFFDGYAHLWMADIDYKNLKTYAAE